MRLVTCDPYKESSCGEYFFRTIMLNPPPVEIFLLMYVFQFIQKNVALWDLNPRSR